jgi:predicted TIM-barrel fold metal-dependent hydrolase
MVTRRQALITITASGAAALASRMDQSVAAQAPMPATPINFKPPAGTTDTHRHVFGDIARYPYAPTSGYRHPTAFIAEMNRFDAALGIERSVLIQPSGYGTDNSALLDAMKGVERKSIRGVVALGDQTSDTTMMEWHAAGVRGIRVGLGSDPAGASMRLKSAADRIKGQGWHINAAISQIAAIDGLADTVAHLSVPVVLDHYAGAKASDGVAQKGFATLLQLLKSGNFYLKMSRLHNLSDQAPGYADVRPLAVAVIAANTERLLWGTDWPHAGIRPEGYSATDTSPYFKYDDGLVFNEFAAWVGNSARLETILVDNPARLYGF